MKFSWGPRGMGTPGMGTPGNEDPRVWGPRGMGTPGNGDPTVPIANLMRNSCKQQYIMKCQFTYAIGQNWSGKQLWTHTGTFNKISFIPMLIHSDSEIAGIQLKRLLWTVLTTGGSLDPMIFNQIWTELDQKLRITVGFLQIFAEFLTFFKSGWISNHTDSNFPCSFASFETQAIPAFNLRPD